MRKKRLLLSFMLMFAQVTLIFLMGCSGCGKNYDKVSIELDKSVMTIFMDETQNQEGDDKLKATILGLDDDMVDSFSYLVSDPTVAEITLDTKYDNISNFKVTPYMGGETEIYIISNETSTKQASITLRVVEPLKGVEVNNSISLYVTVGSTEKTLSITPSNALKLEPETTSETFFDFEILNYSSEYASYDNSTNILTIKPEIQQGILQLKAKFNFDKEKSAFGEEIYNKVNEISNSEAKNREDLIINVYIIKELDSTNFVLSEDGNPLGKTNGKYDKLELVQNNSTLCYKEITATINEELTKTEGFTYSITAKCITSNDIEVTRLTDTATNNDVTFKLNAVFQNENAKVGFFVTLNEVQGYEQEFDLPFNIILIPETIKINGDDGADTIDAVVYSKFQNSGTKFTIEINPIGADNRKFYFDVAEDYNSMIEIVNDSDGRRLTAKEILNSGSTVYIRSLNNSTGEITISVVAVGTTKYENITELRRDIKLKLVIGAEEITPYQTTVYIERKVDPITQKDDSESYSLEFSLSTSTADDSEIFTEYVYATSYDKSICIVPEIMDGTARQVLITPINVGQTVISIELSNGVKTEVTIICYMYFNDFGITLPSVNDVNSVVSEAIYTTTTTADTSKVKTVTQAKININGELQAQILPYKEIDGLYYYTAESAKSIRSTTYTVRNLNNENISIVRMDSSGNMTCLNVGTVEITCEVRVYKNAFDGQDTSNKGKVVFETLTRTFTVQVIIPIESFEIIGGSIDVYAYNRLSYYDKLNNVGTITANLKILPENATYNSEDIIWSIDTTYLSLVKTSEDRFSSTYNCNLLAGQFNQSTAVTVTLSANGRNYASSKTIRITSPKKVSYINLNSVPDYTLDSNGNEIPYVYFDGRTGLNDSSNYINLGAECMPRNAYNTKVRYIVGEGLGGDPNPIIRVEENGNIIPISNGYCYLYIVAEDWFETATEYTGYENFVRIVAVKVADGKSKATAIDVKTANDLMSINSESGLALHYVLKADVDMTNKPNFTPFGLIEDVVVDNNITTNILRLVSFTGSLDGKYNVFGQATQYKITGLSIKNTKYVLPDNYYYQASSTNNYALYYGLFAENKGELSNLVCNITSIMISSIGQDERATTYFGVLAGVNRGLIENCDITISNLSGNELYVRANTKSVNIGIIAGLNQGYIEDDIAYSAKIDNCYTDGIFNVEIFSSTQRNASGELVTGSRNIVYIGGIVGKSAVYKDGELTAKAIITGSYNYYSGVITFEAEEMNARGIINLTSNTDNYINQIAVGGIVGYADSSEISNVASEITISNTNELVENIGGVVGIANNSNIKGVYFSGVIEGKNIGGIAGTLSSGSMENAITEFMDTLEDEVFGVTGLTGSGNIGGLVGTSQNTEIKYSFARSYYVREMTELNYLGDIYLAQNNNGVIGGLVGNASNTTIETSYSYLNIYVSGGGCVGGLVGYSTTNVNISNCYVRNRTYKENLSVKTDAISINDFNVEYTYSSADIRLFGQQFYSYQETLKRSDKVIDSVSTINDIETYVAWSRDIWEVEEGYNDDLPYIKYNGYRMINQPPSSISYDIKESTIISVADLYKLNKFIKVDDETILLFKYDNETLDSYNLNSILNFTIPPYFKGGQSQSEAISGGNNQFQGIATIRLTIKSSDTTIAKINSNGTLTVYGEGSVVITIASMLNKNAFAEINIAVVNVTTGFDIYKDNQYQESLEDGNENRLLIKEGTNFQIYPYISGNSNTMIEYSVVTTSSNIPINIIPNLDTEIYHDSWVQKDSIYSYIDIDYYGTHIIEAVSPGTLDVEARLFVYVKGNKVYLPYTKIFTVQSYEGLNDFTLSHTSFSGIIKDRYEFTAKVSSDIVDRTIFTISAVMIENNISVTTYKLEDVEYKVSEMLNITYFKNEIASDYVIYGIYVEIDDKYKASDIFFDTRNFKIICNVDDGQGIDYGIPTELNLSITINPQDVSSVETMFFGGGEVTYTYNEYGTVLNETYNVAEVDTDVITAGEVGIFKVFIYPEFSQIRNVYIYAASSDGKNLSIEQVGFRAGSYNAVSGYYTLSPSPASYSTQIVDTVYTGLKASIVSNVVIDTSSDREYIASTSFNGYLYFKMLTGSEVELGTVYTIYVKVETYDTTQDPIIKKTKLYAEERIGVTLYYGNSLDNSNFEYITSYNDDDPTSSHTLEFITRRIGENPYLSISFYDGDTLINSNKITYDFNTDEKEVETVGISYRYYIKNFQVDSSFEGMTLIVLVTAIDVEDNSLIYYSNRLKLKIVPYIVNDVTVDGINNNRELIKPYGGSYNLNVNLTTSGTCSAVTKRDLKTAIATSGDTWWYYEFNEFENTKVFTRLRSKTYEYFTITKDSYYVYTPNYVGFTDKMYLVVSLTYYKGDADTSAGYQIVANSGPTATEKGINPDNESLNFVLEFTLSSNYRNSEEQSLPIYDQDGLENMEEGVYYILDNDIELENWDPINTAVACLDGNGYEITIKSFAPTIVDSECTLGLFGKVASNTVLKNLYVTYGKCETNTSGNNVYEFQLDTKELITLYFGGIAGVNYGTIYNCSTQNADGRFYMQLYRTDTKEIVNYDVKMAGLVGYNYGSVSYSRSELTLISNVGYLAGLVSYNEGTLSSSYYKNGKIKNNSTNAITAMVAGVCCTNAINGKIYYSYAEGTPATNNEFQMSGSNSGLEFSGNIGGFVYENAGIISNCYANIPIRPSGGRSAGFVVRNTTGQILCCYTLCKYIYTNMSAGTNAADAPFIGSNAQGQVNFDSENGKMENVYYYIGDFSSSVKAIDLATGLTKVQFMEEYYFGEFSFSYDGEDNMNAYNNYYYQETANRNGDKINNLISYSGLDAVWTYDEFHLYPKLVEANNIAVSRKEVSFTPFVEVCNYYSTFAIGYNNNLLVATNKLNDGEVIKLTITNQSGTILFTAYSNENKEESTCGEDESLSTYYVSVFNFEINPNSERFTGISTVKIEASVVIRNGIVNGSASYDTLVRKSGKLNLSLTKEEDYENIELNENYDESVNKAMEVEFSSNPITGQEVAEKINGLKLYSAEPGSKGNPDVIANAEQYNTTMYMDPSRPNIEQLGNYRLISDIDFSSTNIDENAVNNIFAGIFDGAGFTMEGMTLIDYSKTIDSFGLFNTIIGESGKTGVVKNIRLVPLKVYANYIFTVGTLAAKVVGGRVYNIIVDAEEVTVKGKNIVGGVIGMVLDNILVNGEYYEFLSDDLTGSKTIFRSLVQNITSTVNVNATSRVSSTNYYLISNITSKNKSFYEQNVKVAYSGCAIGAVIQSSGTSRLTQAGVYDVIVKGNSIGVGEIVGTAIGFIGDKSYVDLVKVLIDTDQYLNASLMAGGIVGENRGLLSRAIIEHEDIQELIDTRDEEGKEHASQNIKFFKNAALAIGGIVGFNNGGIVENSYSRIDVRNVNTIISGGVAGIVISGEFYNTYTTGSVYAKTIIGGFIGATSTANLFAPLSTSVNGTASFVSAESYSQISTKKEVILDSVLALNKWLEIDYSTFYENVHNSNNEITDAYPIGAMIGSIQLDSETETSSYDITTYSCAFKRLYVLVDELTNEAFTLYDYGNKINSLVSSGVAYSNTQNSSGIYQNTYATEISNDQLYNKNAFKDYSITIWENTDLLNYKILPTLRAVSNLNTKRSTLTIKQYNSSNVIVKRTILLIDGTKGEEVTNSSGTIINKLGTVANPYKIVAPTQLRYFALKNNIMTNGSFKEGNIHLELADNISLIAYTNWIPIGDGTTLSNGTDYHFKVSFEGNNYQISGITCSSATAGAKERLVGLFGYLESGSVINNLRTKVRYNLELEGGNVYVGGIAGTAYNTIITDCEAEGKINFLNKYATYFSIGGIAGQAVSTSGKSNISNSNSYVEITSKNIVSRVTKSGDSYVDSIIDNIDAKVGGIVGYNENSIVNNCANYGSIIMYPVKGETPTSFTEPTFRNDVYVKDTYAQHSVFKDILYIGGIAGTNLGQVLNSTNNGAIYSYSYAGGIVGNNIGTGQIAYSDGAYNISRCINTGIVYLTPGSIQYTYAGGIAALSSGSINECINLNTVTAKTRTKFSIGGLVGKMDNNTNSYIQHSYSRAYTDYNNTSNVVIVEPVSIYVNSSSVNANYGSGLSSSSSSTNLNIASLICGDIASSVTQARINDNMSYGDIYVNDSKAELSFEVSGSVVYIKKATSYLIKTLVATKSQNQATFGRVSMTDKGSKSFGTSTPSKTDTSIWNNGFFSVPKYNVSGNLTITLPELRWNAKSFTIKIAVSEPGQTLADLDGIITANLINSEGSDAVDIGSAVTYYIGRTKGYIEFTLNGYEIYRIRITRSDDSSLVDEYEESDLVSTNIAINGYTTDKGILHNIQPEKDIDYTIQLYIRRIE